MKPTYSNSKINLYFGNCLDVMPLLDVRVDMVLADLPYGKTKNKWDTVIDPVALWKNYRRLVKPDGAILLFGQDKFSAIMMLSNERDHRYNWIWEKSSPTGHLNAKKMPMRCHEDIMVFYKKLPYYNPQKTTGHPRKVSTEKHKRNSKVTENYGAHGLTSYDSTERYPRSVLKFKTDKQKSAIHPNQKPVDLLRYLIRTYSRPGEIVLDNTMGSGGTGVACILEGRQFIGIDKTLNIYRDAEERIINQMI